VRLSGKIFGGVAMAGRKHRTVLGLVVVIFQRCECIAHFIPMREFTT
jgi:hypothetical protein